MTFINIINLWLIKYQSLRATYKTISYIKNISRESLDKTTKIYTVEEWTCVS